MAEPLITDSFLHSIAYGSKTFAPISTVKRIAKEALHARTLLRCASRELHDWITSARGKFHRDVLDDSRVVRDAIWLHLEPGRDAPQEDEAVRLLRQVHAHIGDLRDVIKGLGENAKLDPHSALVLPTKIHRLGMLERTLEAAGAFLEPKKLA